jgi:hypothetical protein
LALEIVLFAIGLRIVNVKPEHSKQSTKANIKNAKGTTAAR